MSGTQRLLDERPRLLQPPAEELQDRLLPADQRHAAQPAALSGLPRYQLRPQVDCAGRKDTGRLFELAIVEVFQVDRDRVRGGANTP